MFLSDHSVLLECRNASITDAKGGLKLVSSLPSFSHRIINIFKPWPKWGWWDKRKQYRELSTATETWKYSVKYYVSKSLIQPSLKIETKARVLITKVNARSRGIGNIIKWTISYQKTLSVTYFKDLKDEGLSQFVGVKVLSFYISIYRYKHIGSLFYKTDYFVTTNLSQFYSNFIFARQMGVDGYFI